MRTVLAFTIGFLMLSGCASPGPEEKNAAAATRLFEAFNKHNWQEMASLYSEDALFLDPSYGQEYVRKSRKETAAKYLEMEKMFPDIRDEIIGIYPSGDIVTVEFVSTGTMNDSINFKLPIISVLTFENGLIVKDATYYDLENP
jgi:ketosteroid isomerase-like protein